jgi:AraC-like DNA-binding protein
VLELKRQVESARRETRPVMLHGPTGNEAMQVALAIHHGSDAADQAFVHIDCRMTLETPRQWVERAGGGTLYLSDLDHLPEKDQMHLWRKLGIALGEDARRTVACSQYAERLPHVIKMPCRLIVSLADEITLDRFSAHHSIHSTQRIDWKAIDIPRLSQRKDDIPALIRSVLAHYGHDPESRITEELLDWCAHQPWHGDAAQLEWFVARLALLTDDEPIRASDIERHAPQLIFDIDVGRNHTASLRQDATCVYPQIERNAPSPSPSAAELLLQAVIENNPHEFSRVHAGLSRALQIIATRYREPITTQQIARDSHVSASHLRFLFRETIGLSFTLFLQRVRIAHAARLLRDETPRRIGDVAQSVGFCDPSHFQNCFRAIVGRTPGDFRRERSSSNRLERSGSKRKVTA